MKIKGAPKHAPEITLQDAEKKHADKIPAVEIRPLGAGAYKKIQEVLVQRHHHDPQPQAMALPQSDIDIEGLKRECKISRKLTQRGAPHILDMKLINLRQKHHRKRVAALMPLCTGNNLMEFMATHRELPLSTRMKLADELVASVEGIHTAHYCHLDLKEENVLVKLDEDGTPHIELGDFGTAKHMGQTISPCGTFPPPEMYEKLSRRETMTVEPSLDLWPLGSILHTLTHRISPLREHQLGFGYHLTKEFFLAQAQRLSHQVDHMATQTGEETDRVISQLLSMTPHARPTADKVHAVFAKWLREHQ